ncbi:MAG: TIGR01777 family protein [Gemmataceae bacterium]|nr:TIGR01777 family protein [Gemmataceae bacterium]
MASPWKVAISGASGLIGSALVPFLIASGHEVFPLVRGVRQSGGNAISWNPDTGQIDSQRCEGLDAVIHLAGENIAGKRWSKKQKERIRASRVEGTRFLCQSFARLKKPPQVLISASAVGYYGERGDEILTETSLPGTGFLSEVCQEWEGAAQSASSAGIRLIHLRLGMVLTPLGGALKKMLTPFRLCLGGCLGSGKQWQSWVALHDVLSICLYLLQQEKLSGPVNAVSPSPVTNREFTVILGKALCRPTLFAVPGLFLKLLFGEMASALLLSSTRVLPEKLLQSGFTFQFGNLDGALKELVLKQA